MLKYALKRFSVAILVAITVSLITFSMIYLSGDPAMALAGETATQQDIESIRRTYGYDKPIIVQYLMWLGNALTGDLGHAPLASRFKDDAAVGDEGNGQSGQAEQGNEEVQVFHKIKKSGCLVSFYRPGRMPPEAVIRLERILRRHWEEAQAMRVAEKQAAAHHGKKNVGPHPAVDDFGLARGVVAQGAETFPQVLDILVGHTAVELDVGVGREAAKFEVDEGQARQRDEIVR